MNAMVPIIKELQYRGLLRRRATLVNGEKVVEYRWTILGKDALDFAERVANGPDEPGAVE